MGQGSNETLFGSRTHARPGCRVAVIKNGTPIAA
jgi:hypothetical protein